MALTTAHFVCRGSRRLTISFGSYILGIGRGYRDTRRSRLRIMGEAGAAAPRWPGLAAFVPPAIVLDRPSAPGHAYTPH